MFAANLKKLLLGAPVRGKVVLGVDPGFRNGCKWAIMSTTGSVLEHGISNLHDKRTNLYQETAKLADLMKKHRLNIMSLL